MNSISDYKGLILITFIILAILYFSPDLECMLLFSGILVNIITICLNTGALKIATIGNSNSNSTSNKASFNNSIPERFINVRNQDAVDEYLSEKPRFDHLTDKSLERELPSINTDDDKKETLTTKLEYKEFPPVAKYKGAVDYADVSEPAQVATDRVPLAAVTHQGANSRRQTAGAYQLRKLLFPAVARELEQEESKPWWQAYDESTTIDPKTAHY
tara:strand:+ start:2512 stop:3159 length:648 start_codon:yes stop_codon:yes gene_type:complete